MSQVVFRTGFYKYSQNYYYYGVLVIVRFIDSYPFSYLFRLSRVVIFSLLITMCIEFTSSFYTTHFLRSCFHMSY